MHQALTIPLSSRLYPSFYCPIRKQLERWKDDQEVINAIEVKLGPTLPSFCICEECSLAQQ
jgi:hypothetical protein